MPDRLQELLQQRALIKEHLAWLEAEIAAASGKPPPDSPPATSAKPEARRVVMASVPIPRSTSTTPPISANFEETRRQELHAEALLEKLASEGKGKADAIPNKSGCWVIFSIVLIACGAGAWLLLRYFYH